MKYLKMSEDSFKESVEKVMYFKSEKLLNVIIDTLREDRGVLVRAQMDIGRTWKYGDYQYKFLVPFVDKHGRLYSTDLYKREDQALNGQYQIYIHANQRATMMVEEVVSPDREQIDPRYKEDKYGIFIPEVT